MASWRIIRAASLPLSPRTTERRAALRGIDLRPAGALELE